MAAPRQLEVRVACAVWAGAGTAPVALIGITCFSEPVTGVKTVSLVLVVAGVIGLDVGSQS